MQFTQEQDPLSYTIRACHSHAVDIVHPAQTSGTENGESPSVRQETLSDSFIMTPKKLIRDWAPADIGQLQAGHLGVLLGIQPEVLLLGTGEKLVFPDMQILSELMQAGIGVEVMDNSAACRTYNILMHEGREIAAAILQ